MTISESSSFELSPQDRCSTYRELANTFRFLPITLWLRQFSGWAEPVLSFYPGLQKNFQKFFEKWLGKILTIPLILFALDSSLPFSLRASLVRAGPRSFTVQTFGLLIPARTLW
jgi:hypothetical protein